VKPSDALKINIEAVLAATERHKTINAREFVEGMNKDEFLLDKRSQKATIYSLQIIGEAATKLMDQHPELVRENPTIPWLSMRGMRNRIAHGYFQIDLEIVWDTV